MSDFVNFKLVKTRKTHKCLTCGRIIPKGKQAFNYKGLYEGDWQHWYMCIPCDENVTDMIDEYISGEEFSEWLMQQPEYECLNCHGMDTESNRQYHWSHHIDWDWSDDYETVQFECELCGHKWSKHIGFDVKSEVANE